MISLQSLIIFIIIFCILCTLSNCELAQPKELKHLRTPRNFLHPKVFRCGEAGKEMVANFVNKNYPEPDEEIGNCNFRLFIANSNICQIRADFVDTELMYPVRGECTSQNFVIEGPIWPTGIPPLCGTNNDQHFYIHLDSSPSNGTFIDFKISTFSKMKPYKFGLWLTQIDCSNFNVLKAPEGCTQYFLGEKGTLKSFNFEGSRYLKGQNYQVCIRPGRGICGIRYDAQENGEFIMRKTVKGSNRDIQTKSGLGSKTCGSDYLMIPEGRNSLKMIEVRKGKLIFKRRRPIISSKKGKEKLIGLKPSSDRFCGGFLSPSEGDIRNRPIFARVRSNLITLKVRTTGILNNNNNAKQGQNLTIGFKLNFIQLRDCDENEKDMANQSSITNILQSIQMTSSTSTSPIPPPSSSEALVILRDSLVRRPPPIHNQHILTKYGPSPLPVQLNLKHWLNRYTDKTGEESSEGGSNDKELWDYLEIPEDDEVLYRDF